MNKKVFPLAAGAAVAAGLAVHPAKAQEKPNIIIIYTDDLGYSDISLYGGKFTRTENIDRIGREGIQFNQYYTSCPISSPSRVGMTTGMYPTKWGITTFLNNRKANRANSSNDYLSSDAPAVARSFQQGGYATAHIGKWHMGGGRDVTDMPHIKEYGFDEWCSTWESPDPDPLITASNWIWSDQDSIKRWERTSYFIDRTIDFLKRHNSQPCYIHIWPDDMHTPYVPDKETYEKGRNDNGLWDRQVNFTPVLSELDRQIGRLLDFLDETGLAENTIVIFSSDNGPNPSYRNARTAGLRGQKGTLYEGGIRLPLMVRWPARIKPGQVNENTVITAIDLFPTLCSLAGIEPVTNGYTLDGLDMSKTLLSSKDKKRKSPMYWEFGQHFVGRPAPGNAYQTRSPNIAVRDGDWKVLVNYDGTSLELYNLRDDVYETENVADKYPKIAEKMKRMAIEWYNENFRKHAGNL